MSPPIFLIQLLCPLRHALLATMFDPVKLPQAIAMQRLEEQRQQMKLNPWCGICGSRNLAYEVRTTKFKTIEDAVAAAHMLEAEQIETRRELDEMGLTYDSKKRPAPG